MVTPKEIGTLRAPSYIPRCAGVPKNLVAWMCSLRCSSRYAKKPATNPCANEKLNMNLEGEKQVCCSNNQNNYLVMHLKSKKKTKRKTKRSRKKCSMCVPCNINDENDKIDELKQIMYCANDDEAYPYTSVQKCKNRRITFHKCPKYDKNKNIIIDYEYDKNENLEACCSEDEDDSECRNDYDEDQNEDDCCYIEEKEDGRIMIDPNTNNNKFRECGYYPYNLNENNVCKKSLESKNRRVCCNCSAIKDYDDQNCDCDEIDAEDDTSDENCDDEINLCDKAQSKMCYKCEIEEAVRRQCPLKTKFNKRKYCDVKKNIPRKDPSNCGCSDTRQNKKSSPQKIKLSYKECIYRNQKEKFKKKIEKNGCMKNYNFPQPCKSAVSSKIGYVTCSCKEKFKKDQDVCDFCNIEGNKRMEYETFGCPEECNREKIKNQTKCRGKSSNADNKNFICQEMCVNLEHFDSGNNENRRSLPQEAYFCKGTSRKSENACDCITNKREMESQKYICPNKNVNVYQQKTGSQAQSRNVYCYQKEEVDKIESNCPCANLEITNNSGNNCDRINVQSNKKTSDCICSDVNEFWDRYCENIEENIKSKFSSEPSCDCCICKQEKTVRKNLCQNDKRLEFCKCGQIRENEINKDACEAFLTNNPDNCKCINLNNENEEIPTQFCSCQEKERIDNYPENNQFTNQEICDTTNCQISNQDHVNEIDYGKNQFKTESELGSYNYDTSTALISKRKYTAPQSGQPIQKDDIVEDLKPFTREPQSEECVILKTCINEPQQMTSAISQLQPNGYLNTQMDGTTVPEIPRGSVFSKKGSVYEPQQMTSAIGQQQPFGYLNTQMDGTTVPEIPRGSVFSKKGSVYEPQQMTSAIGQQQPFGYLNTQMDGTTVPEIPRGSVFSKKGSVYEPQQITSTISQKQPGGYFNTQNDGTTVPEIPRGSVFSKKGSVYEPQQMTSAISQQQPSDYLNTQMDGTTVPEIPRGSLFSKKGSVYEPQQMTSAISQQQPNGYLNTQMNGTTVPETSQGKAFSKQGDIYEPCQNTMTNNKNQNSKCGNKQLDCNNNNCPEISRRSLSSKKRSNCEPCQNACMVDKGQTSEYLNEQLDCTSCFAISRRVCSNKANSCEPCQNACTISEIQTNEYLNTQMDGTTVPEIPRGSVFSKKASVYEPQQMTSAIGQQQPGDYLNTQMNGTYVPETPRGSVFSKKASVYEPQQRTSAISPPQPGGYLITQMDGTTVPEISRGSVFSKKGSVYEPQQRTSAISQQQPGGYLNTQRDGTTVPEISRGSVFSKKGSVYEPQQRTSAISQQQPGGYLITQMDGTTVPEISKRSIFSKKGSVYEPQQRTSAISQQQPGGYLIAQMDGTTVPEIPRRSILSKKGSIYEPQQITSAVSQKQPSGYLNTQMDGTTVPEIPRGSVFSKKGSVYEPQQMTSAISQKQASSYISTQLGEPNPSKRLSNYSTTGKTSKRESTYTEAGPNTISEYPNNAQIIEEAVDITTEVNEPEITDCSCPYIQPDKTKKINDQKVKNTASTISKNYQSDQNDLTDEPVQEKGNSETNKNDISKIFSTYRSVSNIQTNKQQINIATAPNQSIYSVNKNATSGVLDQNNLVIDQSNNQSALIPAEQPSVIDPNIESALIPTGRQSTHSYNPLLDHTRADSILITPGKQSYHSYIPVFVQSKIESVLLSPGKQTIYSCSPVFETSTTEPVLLPGKQTIQSYNVMIDQSKTETALNQQENQSFRQTKRQSKNNTDINVNKSGKRTSSCGLQKCRNKITPKSSSCKDPNSIFQRESFNSKCSCTDNKNMDKKMFPRYKQNKQSYCKFTTSKTSKRGCNNVSEPTTLYNCSDSTKNDSLRYGTELTTSCKCPNDTKDVTQRYKTEGTTLCKCSDSTKPRYGTEGATLCKCSDSTKPRYGTEGATSFKCSDSTKPRYGTEETALCKCSDSTKPRYGTEGATSFKCSDSTKPRYGTEETALCKCSDSTKPRYGTEGTALCKCSDSTKPRKGTEGTALCKCSDSTKPPYGTEGTTLCKCSDSTKPSYGTEGTALCKCSDSTKPPYGTEGDFSDSSKPRYGASEMIPNNPQIQEVMDTVQDGVAKKSSSVVYKSQACRDISKILSTNSYYKLQKSKIKTPTISQDELEENADYDAGSQKSRRSVEFVCPARHQKTDEVCNINKLTKRSTTSGIENYESYIQQSINNTDNIEPTSLSAVYVGENNDNGDIIETKGDEPQTEPLNVEGIYNNVEEKVIQDNDYYIVKEGNQDKSELVDKTEKKECCDYGNFKAKKDELLEIKPYLCKVVCRDQIEDGDNSILDEDTPCRISECNIYEKMITSRTSQQKQEKTFELFDYANLEAMKDVPQLIPYICKDMCRDNVESEDDDDEVLVVDVPYRISECDVHKDLFQTVSGKCICQQENIQTDCCDYGNIKAKQEVESQVKPYVCRNVERPEEDLVAEDPPCPINECDIHNKFIKNAEATCTCQNQIENTKCCDKFGNPSVKKDACKVNNCKRMNQTANNQFPEVNSGKYCECKNADRLSDDEVSKREKEESDTNYETIQSKTEIKELDNIFQDNLDEVVAGVKLTNIDKSRSVMYGGPEVTDTRKSTVPVSLPPSMFKQNIDIFDTITQNGVDSSCRCIGIQSAKPPPIKQSNIEIQTKNNYKPSSTFKIKEIGGEQTVNNLTVETPMGFQILNLGSLWDNQKTFPSNK